MENRTKKVKRFLKDMQSRMYQRKNNGTKFSVQNIAKEHGLSTSILGTAKDMGFGIDMVVDNEFCDAVIEKDNERRRLRRRNRKARREDENEGVRKEAYFAKKKVYNLNAKVDALNDTIDKKDNRIASLVTTHNNTSNDLSKCLRKNKIQKEQLEDMRNTISSLDEISSKNNTSWRECVKAKDTLEYEKERLMSLLQEEYNISASYRKLNEELHDSVNLRNENIKMIEKELALRKAMPWWRLIFNPWV